MVMLTVRIMLGRFHERGHEVCHPRGSRNVGGTRRAANHLGGDLPTASDHEHNILSDADCPETSNGGKVA